MAESGGGYSPVEIPTGWGNVSTAQFGPVDTSPAPMAPLGAAAPTTQAATMAAVAAPGNGLQAPGANGLTGGSTPQFNPITGEQLNPGFFQSGGALQIGLGALQTLGNLWNSFQQIKLAKDQFKFQKNAWTTAHNDQTKTYNTSLENRARTAGQFNGTDQAVTDQYVKDHSL